VTALIYGVLEVTVRAVYKTAYGEDHTQTAKPQEGIFQRIMIESPGDSDTYRYIDIRSQGLFKLLRGTIRCVIFTL
jgi:hypothetical protein